jgi:hypothetical protein
MARPEWTLNSNTSLATLQERETVSIQLSVFDPEDRSTIETQQFENYIDSTIIENYADELFFYIKSTGLPQHTIKQNPTGYPNNIPKAQNYVFKIPRQRSIINTIEKINALEFIGVARDGVPFKSSNSGKIAKLGQKFYTENRVIFPVQNYFEDGSGLIDIDKKFYYHSDPVEIYTKTPGIHSPILGYAFDGSPIYGPYGYSDPTDKNSTVRIIKSSYRLCDEQRDNGTLPDGTYIEDFVYDSTVGDLDEYNGRFCITPEYPGGIYAYFITVDPDDGTTPRYPYVIGPKYFNNPILPNKNFIFPKIIDISVISGQLPPGLRISGDTIIGTPFEVSRVTEFKFVLRASNIDGFSDRTYSITVEGPDEPIWLTPPGILPVGTSGQREIIQTRTTEITKTSGSSILQLNSVFNLRVGSKVSSSSFPQSINQDTTITSINTTTKEIILSKPLESILPFNTDLTISYFTTQTNLFILDNSEINYKLSAIDSDLAAGQSLRFYIPPKGGQLPPGITLSEDGVLSGFTDPLISADQQDLNGGNYDMNLYDKFAYDYGVRPYNGYDSFLYDTTTYDFSDRVRTPRKLNRFYQFVVRVSDGVYFSDRTFKIYVVGDDFLRADNTIMQVGTGTYTADVTPIRKPIWITGQYREETDSFYLGRRRANNYITTFLDVYDPATLQGTISYILEPFNNDGTTSTLPPGMQLDQLSGEIYGDVPYQPAVTKTYKFTVTAVRYDPQSVTYAVQRNIIQNANQGQNTFRIDTVENIRVGSIINSTDSRNLFAVGTSVINIDVNTKTITTSNPLLENIRIDDRLLFSFLVSSSRTFTLDIIGEVDSTIRFITPGNLGSIPANFISNLSVEAVTTVTNSTLNYTLIGGKLPPGLTLVSDGTIQGKVNQYATLTLPGLTTFDNITTTFDNETTTIDREYTFIVLAQDKFKYSAVTKIFTIKVTTPNDLLYSNITTKPLLPSEKRLELLEFFSNQNIFERDLLYRPSDPEFGIQRELKMLVYAGIETVSAGEYASAFGRSYKKRFRFGNLKKGIAKIPGTNTVVYEVVYLEMLDNQENSKGSIPKIIETKFLNKPITVNQSRRDMWDSDITDNNIAQSNLDSLPRIWQQDKVMTADYDGQRASDINKSNIFGNSITNIRNKVAELGDNERLFLPLWMRTPQTFSGIEQGFTKAVVLCYCKPGTADRIITNIKNLGIDFKKINYTIDRVIIDSVEGEVGDKYIMFAAREVING